VIAVGGGVTTDLAGFVAATFLRGVPVVQVPTSYLAMIDASVGGKTGVDVHAGKNLVGAFHPPRLVLADPEVLGTLPVAERAQGLVEALKHGAILDADYFASLEAGLEQLLAADAEAAGPAVARSVELKAAVVSEDEFEGGYRQILNFGHTLGHAIEAASAYTLGHGSAVAMGMLLETRLGERKGVTASGTYERLAGAFDALLGPLQDVEIDPAVAVGYLRTDKKARGGRPRVVLLRRLGEVDPGDGWSHEVSEEALADELAAGLGVA
jgi:3-dehydroquinate synthase